MVRRGSLFGVAALALAAAIAGPVAARPGVPRAASAIPEPHRFTADEREVLLAGGIVPRPMRFQRGSGRYVGGVSYQVVNAPPAVVYASVTSVRHLPKVLPNTLAARRILEPDAILRIELTQGTTIVRATYTVCLVSDPLQASLRFWLDPAYPHDIDDAWGYVRAQPFGANRSLVTVAAALDLGPGLPRLLFEDAVQTVALAIPHYIGEFVEPRYLALR